MHRTVIGRLAALTLGVAALAAHAAPAATAWKLDQDGFGPLKIGMDFGAARRASGKRLQATPPPQGNPQCDQMLLPGHPGVSLMFVDGTLQRIDIYRPGIRTTRGIAPGDSLRRLRQAYPDLTATPHKYASGEQVLTAGPEQERALRFQTRKGRIDRIYGGRWQEVQLVEGCF
jgi:hypothetical protein